MYSELKLFRRFFRTASPDPDFVASDLPKIFWVELTSTCPFDCIFCSRKNRRGEGRHMPFGLYRDFIRQLREPEILRLNYAGESIHYPLLPEAIELAAATGARTELVSAFATFPETMITKLVGSGLDNLTISLHTMDAEQYKAIYRHGSLDRLKGNIDRFLQERERHGANTPELSLAFVAMRRNLSQLPAVADYGKRIGAVDLFVQPVHIRDSLPERFDEELNNHPGNAAFKDDIRRVADDLGRGFPDMNIARVCMEEAGPWFLDHVPRSFPPRLPAGCRIHSCDQNPWDTAHILSNGDVVACEVIDRRALGNLNRQTLSEIWHGRYYRRFRQGYIDGSFAACRDCPFKSAYRPRPPDVAIEAKHGMSSQLLRGWFGNDDSGIIWSKDKAVAVLKCPSRGRRLRLQGILPGMRGQTSRVLDVRCNGTSLGLITNDAGEFLSFDRTLPINRPGSILNLQFTVTPSFRPSDWGPSRDFRTLGFALIRMEAE